MPRSPTDATRFTATGPYASTSTNFSSLPSKAASTPSPSIGTRVNIGAGASVGETPQQKIARLRAAAAAAKLGKESSFDWWVRNGRVWADRAHRITAWSLLGATVLCAAFAGVGVTDMIVHNRRRKKEWLAEKQAEHVRQLAEARAAELQGSLTEDQTLLLNRIRAAVEAEQERKNRPGIFKRAKNALFSGLATDQKPVEETSSSPPISIVEEVRGEKENKGVLQAVQEEVEANRKQVESIEGSWPSWLKGR